jgi:hypothetical protein
MYEKDEKINEETKDVPKNTRFQRLKNLQGPKIDLSKVKKRFTPESDEITRGALVNEYFKAWEGRYELPEYVVDKETKDIFQNAIKLKLTTYRVTPTDFILLSELSPEKLRDAVDTEKNFKETMAKLRAQTVDSAARTGLWWFVWLWIMLQSGFIITAYRKEKDNQDPQYTRQNRQISKGLYLFAVVSMTTAWVAIILRLLRHVPMEKNVVKTSKRMSDVYLLILWNFVLGCWAVNDTRKSPNPGTNKVVLGLGAAAIVVGVLFVLLLRIWPPIAVYVRGY